MKDQATKENALLDHLVVKFVMKNDAALCRALEVAPSIISKIRHGKLPVTDRLILRMHEKLGVPVADIRKFVPAA